MAAIILILLQPVNLKNVLQKLSKMTIIDCSFNRNQISSRTHNLTLQERERLYLKFNPHSDTNSKSSFRNNGGNTGQSMLSGILKKSSTTAAAPCSPSSFPGRLILKSAFTSNSAQDDLSIHDKEKCAILLENYRKQVLNGEICGGDCPNDGISCTTGVCRAHLR